MQTFYSAIIQHFVEGEDYQWTEGEPKVYDNLVWLKGDKPEKQYFIDIVNEDNRLELLERVRAQRNERLSKTDWRFRSDLVPSQEWIDYCQALRDLPDDPSKFYMDDNGLAIITWPEEPTLKKVK
jgi:hypothetical protein